MLRVQKKKVVHLDIWDYEVYFAHNQILKYHQIQKGLVINYLPKDSICLIKQMNTNIL